MARMKSNKKSKARGGLIAALDVGTTKVCCFIARPDGQDGAIRVTGVGHHASKGLRCGEVVNMDEVEKSVRASVEDAEKMAGENISQVIVNLSCGAPRSELIAYGISIAGHEIEDSDLRGILEDPALAKRLPKNHELIHAIPAGYMIDGARGVRDPRGMFGERLSVNMHVISAGSGAVRNLAGSVARCCLDIEGMVVSSYASALSCLVDDEKLLGSALIDMGGGVTSIAVFADNELVHTDTVPLGGAHVTSDIAKGLSTPLVHAERMKILYGNAIPSSADEREIIKAPLIGEKNGAEVSQAPRSLLVGIIRPRLEEIFEMVRQRLEKSGFAKLAGRVVLTGGASQLGGMRELAGMILDRQTRIGNPAPTAGLAESMCGPAFASCAGLLRYAAEGPAEKRSRNDDPARELTSRLDRFGQWLRENL